MIKFLIQLAEKNLLPDFLLRFGIRHLLRKRLTSLIDPNQETNKQNKIKFIEMMDQAKIAEVPELANQQHYEITSDFYDLCLGLHKKYSSCFWDSDTTDLNHAEKDALEITCSRADIQDGLSILELGCGWGSLTLWMAQHY
ncbi:MAG: class I SAM-dependent methyltransferase, partial [Methylophilaceae bacterium]